MKEEEKKKIEQLMGEIQCPKDFKCVKDNFACLCQVRKFGSDEHLECLEKKSFTLSLCSSLYKSPYLHMPDANVHYPEVKEVDGG